MSYILDALKRADAERERGTVPGLHTRAVPTQGAARPHAPGPGRNLLLWGLGAAAVLGAAAAGFMFWNPPGATPGAVVKASPAPASPPAPAITAPAAEPPSLAVQTAAPAAGGGAAPAEAPAPAPAAVPPAPPPAGPGHLLTAPPPPPPTAAPAPALKPPAAAAPMTAALAGKEPPASPPAAAAPAPLPVPAPSTPAAAVPPGTTAPLLSELPEELRRQIPALNITGAVYSANPAQRLLLVNGQVLPQGSLCAPQLTLEEIHARSSVFSFRGTRFRVAH
jgi:general secretion pathway protein B